MEPKFLIKGLISILIMIGSAAMIFARRYKNNDDDAGVGIAGWTIAIIFCIWCS